MVTPGLLLAVLAVIAAEPEAPPTQPDRPTALVLELLENEGWEHSKQTRDDIDIFTRRLAAIPDAPAGMVVKDSDLPPDALLSVLTDENSWTDFMGEVYLSDCRILNPGQDDFHDVYQYLDLPLVLRDRHLVTRIFVQRDLDGVSGRHRMWWTLVPESLYSDWMSKLHARRRGPIYVEETAGCWQLEPLEGGGTRVTYRLLTKPGGRLPGWAVGVGFRSTMPDLLRIVEAEARRRLQEAPPGASETGAE